MAKKIKCITVVAFALSVIFSILNAMFDSAVWLFLTITFVTITYHFGMRLFVGFVFDRIMNNKVDYKRKWFQVSSAEIGFYNAIKVKRWKNTMPTYDPELFSTQNHTWDEIVQAMCQAELVHETIVVLSLLSIIMTIWWGEFWVFLITSIGAALMDLSFVMMQRYNRPRVLRLIKKLEK